MSDPTPPEVDPPGPIGPPILIDPEPPEEPPVYVPTVRTKHGLYNAEYDVYQTLERTAPEGEPLILAEGFVEVDYETAVLEAARRRRDDVAAWEQAIAERDRNFEEQQATLVDEQRAAISRLGTAAGFDFADLATALGQSHVLTDAEKSGLKDPPGDRQPPIRIDPPPDPEPEPVVP